MTNYLESNHIINRNQFGFRNNHSTIDSLIAIIQKICEARNSNQYTCAVTLDLKKAFDIVNHKILFNKMRKNGLKNIVQLLSSYMLNRKQCVKIRTKLSDELSLENFSVIQGSNLGPIYLYFSLTIFLNYKFLVKCFYSPMTSLLYLKIKTFINLAIK